MIGSCLTLSTSLLAADYVFKNGSIYTVDLAQPWADAVAVDGKQIVYVGNNEGVEEHITANTQVIDLDGKNADARLYRHPYAPRCRRINVQYWRTSDSQIYP